MPGGVAGAAPRGATLARLGCEGNMFEVHVADNFHYMDENEVYTHGDFESWADAVAAARKIVDRCLAEYMKPGITADKLYQYYVAFGDDPFITPVPEGEKFSAWDYAKERCRKLCGSHA